MGMWTRAAGKDWPKHAVTGGASVGSMAMARAISYWPDTSRDGLDDEMVR
jgi:hypothetical protein